MVPPLVLGRFNPPSWAHLGLIINKKWKKTIFFTNLQLTWFLEIYYLNFAKILGFKKPRISKLCKFPDRKLRGSPVVGQLIVPKWTFPCFLQPEGTRGVVYNLNNVIECKILVLGHKTQTFMTLIWYWVDIVFDPYKFNFKKFTQTDSLKSPEY